MVMTLGEKFTIFRAKAMPEGCPMQQAMFGQACYLAGAQAALQILVNASGKTAEEAVIIWGSLQKEILDAVGKPKEPIAPPSLVI